MIKKLMTLTAASHEFKLVETVWGKYMIIDNRFIFHARSLQWFGYYYVQSKFTKLRRLYNQVLYRTSKSWPAKITHLVRDVLDAHLDYGLIAAHDWKARFVETVFHVSDNGAICPGSKITAADGEYVIAVLTKMFDSSKELDNACVMYYGLYKSTLRDNIRANDDILRHRLNVPKEQSIVNCLFDE